MFWMFLNSDRDLDELLMDHDGSDRYLLFTRLHTLDPRVTGCNKTVHRECLFSVCKPKIRLKTVRRGRRTSILIK